ncbi:tetratricopeptide repeat protein [Methylocystis sp. ATCC 49242]|uniref:tetratricopeptide repeat protein n=1 Tax=Methylocystis sp. ATCC 49242 TaxID=622637 RepID=UPI0001F87167|nr:tetratricopeptide repeat protein [Methylocystis sp. ATCC 49242]
MPNSARLTARSKSFAARASATLVAATAVWLALPVDSSLAARESLSVARPFEVGTSLSGNYLAAIVAGSARDTFAASTFFREALRDDPRNEDLVDRAFVAALANGNMPEAIPLAGRVVAHDRGNSLAHLARGVDLLKNRKYAAARAELGKGGGDRRRDITSTLLVAWSYAGAKDTRKALQTLDTLNDEAFIVFRDYHAGLIADLGGDKAEAEKRFRNAYSAEKNTLRLVDAYARFLATRGQLDEALKIYKGFDEVAPNHPIVMAGIAALEGGKALPPFVRTAEEGAAEALYGLGAVGGRQGDELASLIYLRLSLYLAPENALAIVTLGDVYERMKQEETAIDLYDSVPEDSPLRVNADVQAALLLETLGKSKEATEHLAAVVAANPKNQEALTALGNLQRSRKMFNEAADTYSRVLALQPKSEKSQWLIYYYRGIANERRKNWPQAEADLKKALELNPDQPLVLNYLGYSWVDQGVNLDDAFRMLRRAVDLRQRDGYVVDSLGWAYYRLGRYDDAVRELEKAIDLKPSDPVINDHLGDAYWRVGRKLEAQFQWNHARDLGPDPEELPKILDKIRNGMTDKPALAGESGKRGG